jgi:hypothetical protein
MSLRSRALPAGFIAPCLPTPAPKPPSGELWLHEIKHDGFRMIARKWGRSELTWWGHSGTIYLPRDSKKAIGVVGLHFGWDKLALKLLGWVYPKGGRDSRRVYAQKTGMKLMPLYEDNDYVVWFEKDLSLKTSRDDLKREIAKRAKQHFRAGVPLLTKPARH